MLDLTSAGGTYQHARHALAANDKGGLSAQAPQPERLAMKEPLPLDRRLRLHHGRHETCRTVYKVNTGKRLVDLECSRLSCLCVNMAPVIKAKCNVAVLLNLKHYDVAAQRVNRSRRDKDAVARLRRNTYQVVGQATVRKRLPENVCSGVRFQARIDAAFVSRLQHHPPFGLRPGRSRPQAPVRVSGVHLD